MKNTGGRRRGVGWWVGRAILVVFLAFSGLVIARGLIGDIIDRWSDDETVETVATPIPAATQTVETPTPTPTPTSTPQVSITPLARAAENKYLVGQVFKVPMTYELCREPGPPEGPNGRCNLWNHVHQGDCVRIAHHKPRLFDQSWGDIWYWAVEVILGGVYTQGEPAYIPDWVILEPVEEEQCVRQEPNYKKGEVVAASYNLELGDAPAGNAVGFDDSGEPLKIFGGHLATIIGTPVLWSDGFYWCKIQPHDLLPEGWVTCEFMKLE
jgi:hypothetical protein